MGIRREKYLEKDKQKEANLACNPMPLRTYHLTKEILEQIESKSIVLSKLFKMRRFKSKNKRTVSMCK